ncbi:carboxypeptidase regulatory-like domain-containing protein [Archangium violaceum]|uniref:carboxypeptidase-like regulatory domain-containing protein n=1 Tax=Archangium violaceum TaxID=83451 RepID=UPI00193B98B9|nr:carboxypeptidase-like regulatory domain-containing protein [Archangium violaceum]QRK09127.1 carboxypeptidase regulatory-like domain-containing protein [Archangium violaceum]
MPHSPPARLLRPVSIALLLAACGSPSSDPPPTTPPERTTGLQGVVAIAPAGAAVTATEIQAYPAEGGPAVATTQSDEHGRYTLALPAGDYSLTLRKSGYAASRVEGVRIPDGGLTRLNLVQQRAFHPSWPTEAPSVDVGDVLENGSYDADNFLPYDVTVDPAGTLPTQMIYAAIGKTPGSAWASGESQSFTQTDTTGPRFLLPRAYVGLGSTTFEVVAYDANNNRTHVIRHVTFTSVLPSTPGQPLAPPVLQSTLAVTFGKALEAMNVHPTAAPEGASLFVNVHWSPATDVPPCSDPLVTIPYKYRVERRIGWGAFTPIATLPGWSIGQDLDGDACGEVIYTTDYRDTSADLQPGTPATYRIVAFNDKHETAPSNTLTSTPLPAFDVRLTGPAAGATGVSTTPTFTWKPTQTVGAIHVYNGLLWDTVSGNSNLNFSSAQPRLVNRDSFTWNEDNNYTGSVYEQLQPGRTYEWQLSLAFAADSATSPTAVSVAADSYGVYGPFTVASTDVFRFTTAP